MKLQLTALLAMAAWLTPAASSAQDAYQNDFSDPAARLAVTGTGACAVADGVLRARDAYAVFGEDGWKDYEFSFRARAPKTAEQVQIWAGFRTYNRFDRYVVGIKGGLQDDLYLMRTGYMGLDEFLGVRKLGFHPVPGEWYRLRVQVCGGRIRVFVGDGKEPLIDVEDKNSGLAPAGGVALGGGWIDTEYDDLQVRPLPADFFKGVKRAEYDGRMNAQQKEEKRVKERALYTPKRLAALAEGRTELSLDGQWLFMPEYQMKDEAKAVSAAMPDEDWHVMTVPDFWTPIRIWLHGETMGTPNGHESKGVSDTYYQQETDRCENYTFDYRRTGAAWYRQWLELPRDIEGKKFVLSFDAVSKMCDVYVNGQKAGSHIGMFGAFEVDVTALVRPGRNLVALKVVRDIKGAAAQTSDAMENYYSSVRKDIAANKDDKQANQEVLTDIPHGFYGDNPAGIWQPVKLVVTAPVKVEDVFIKPTLQGAEFDVTVSNASKKNRKLDVSVRITDKQDGSLLYEGSLLAKQKLGKGAHQTLTCAVDGLKPKLWEPSSPNLYDFTFSLADGNDVIDKTTITSGFRTFEARPDGYLYLNGRKFWLRGGNHIPFALRPNDRELADKFMQLMRQGNVNATRTHTTPWNQLWMDAADRNGIAVSFEGTWSWLMIHSTPIPNASTLKLWHDEWLQVIKKFRNHPSLVFWTVNNEMKFYDLDADKERAKEKFRIISNTVKDMRQVDPTRPVSFDSNYMRRSGVRRFGADFIATVDDGDIDDNHAYYNWYDYSVFKFFNGEFQRDFKTPGRPLISQEMSTGYPNAETGHPTRSYQLIHQNPYSLIGYEAYDWADPRSFLKVQAFITGELAETLRRTCPEASGIMHFAYMTWFRQCYDKDGIQPYPTYFALQRALQPVLVSAELWGRNLYAGERLQTRVYVVNDDEQGRDLGPMTLRWSFTDARGNVLSRGEEAVPAVEYYGRKYIEPAITVPETLPSPRVDGKLRLQLMENGREISANEYDLLLAARQWSAADAPKGKRIAVLGDAQTTASFAAIGVEAEAAASVSDLIKKAGSTGIAVLSALPELPEDDCKALRSYIAKGGRVLMLSCKEAAKAVFPEYITGWINPTEGDIVVMERSDAPVFSGLGPLDLRYFNNNRREMPRACAATLKAVRHASVTELAGQMKIHAYIDGGKPEDRIAKIESMRGLTMLQIADGRGCAIVSTMCTEKAPTDPVAARLLANMLRCLAE